MGRYSEMKRVESDSMKVQIKGANNHGAKTFWFPFLKDDIEDPRPNSDIPISQYFSEGNGGESRFSIYHTLFTILYLIMCVWM